MTKKKGDASIIEKNLEFFSFLFELINIIYIHVTFIFVGFFRLRKFVRCLKIMFFTTQNNQNVF